MARTLSPKALDMLADLPPYLAGEPFVQAVMNAVANEFQRIEDASSAIRDAAIPSQANDVVLPAGVGVAPLLSMWETLLALPVSPTGVTVADRQAKVRAHIQRRNSGAGSDWVAILAQALGTNSWTYQEGPGNYQVTITIPFASGSYTAGQLVALARQVSPAHLDILVSYGVGFIIGVSQIGLQPL